jgi:hypothetical protein
MVFVDFHVAGEIGVEVGLVGGTESKNEVAFQIARVVKMCRGSYNQIELKSDHVTEIGFVYEQERRPQQFLLPMHLRKVIRHYFLVSGRYGGGIGDFIVTFPPKEVEEFDERFFCHQIEVSQKLKDPFQVFAAFGSQVAVAFLCEETSDVVEI